MLQEQVIRLARLGQLHAQTGDLARAEDDFRRCTTLAPSMPQLHRQLALIQLQQDKISSAFETFTHVYQQFPNDKALHESMCRDMVSKIDKFEVASAPLHCQDRLRIARFCKDMDAYASSGDFQSEHLCNSPMSYVSRLHEYTRFLMRQDKLVQAWETAQALIAAAPTPDLLHLAATIRNSGWVRDALGFELEERALSKRVEELGIHEESCDTGTWKLVVEWDEETHNPMLNVLVLNGGRDDRQTQGYVNASSAKTQRIHLVDLPDAFILGRTRVLHRDCVFYTGSHGASVSHNSFPPTFSHSKHSRTIRLKKPVASTVRHFYENYYHWLMEGLPRVIWFRQLRPHLSLLVPPKGIKHVDDSLEFLGLKETDLTRFPIHSDDDHVTDSNGDGNGDDNPVVERIYAAAGISVIDWNPIRGDR